MSDPRISLAAGQPNAFPGFNLGIAAQGANQLAVMQRNQQAAQIGAQQIHSQNALRTILSQPGAIDDQGNPTPDAMKQVTAVDPNMGMQLRQNQLVTQQRQLQMSTLKTKAFQDKLDLLNDQYGEVDKIYKDALAAGKTPEVAAGMAQEELTKVNEGLAQGGQFSPEEIKQHPTQFDPVGFQRFFDGSERIREWVKTQAGTQKVQRDEDRKDAEDAEDKRHHQATEDAIKPSQVEIMTDPGHVGPDGKLQPIQYLYDKVNKRATTLAGDPYTPTGAQKLSATGGGAYEPLSDQALDYAATRYRDTGVLPNLGFGKDALADKRRVVVRAAQMAGEAGGDASSDIVNQAVIKSEQATLTQLTKQRAAIGGFESTALKNGEVLVDLAKKVDTSGVPVVDRWIRAGRQAIEGDPDVSRFHAQLQLYGNEVAKILTNPNLTGVLSDSARKEVQAFLPSGASYEQIKGLTELLKGDFERRTSSLDEQIKGTTEDLRAAAGGKASAKTDDGTKPDPAKNADEPKTGVVKLDALPEEKRAGAVRTLIEHPDTAAIFDSHFGEGAAKKVLDDAKKTATAAPAPGFDEKGQPLPAGWDKPGAKPAAAPAAAPAGKGTGRTSEDPISVTDPAVAAKLPPGTWFRAPDGKVRMRPLVAPAGGPLA